MFPVMLVAFPLAIILALVHFFSEKYSVHVEKYHAHTISFSAGLFLGLIFLNLLPEFFKGAIYLGESIFLLLLAGFVLFHLGEKYIYQHIRDRNELLKDLAAIHVLGFFINHFVLGIALLLAFKNSNPVAGFFIFIPLLLHSFSSSLSLNHIDKHFEKHSFLGMLLPLSPLAGVSFAFLLNPTASLYYGMFSFIIGAMLYIVIRDIVPKGQAGKPLLFLTGVLLSVLAMVALSLL